MTGTDGKGRSIVLYVTLDLKGIVMLNLTISHATSIGFGINCIDLIEDTIVTT